MGESKESNRYMYGELGLGQGMQDLGQQYQQMPWDQAAQYSNLLSQYSGLGGSQVATGTQGGGTQGAIGGALGGAQLQRLLFPNQAMQSGYTGYGVNTLNLPDYNSMPAFTVGGQ